MKHQYNHEITITTNYETRNRHKKQWTNTWTTMNKSIKQGKSSNILNKTQWTIVKYQGETNKHNEQKQSHNENAHEKQWNHNTNNEQSINNKEKNGKTDEKQITIREQLIKTMNTNNKWWTINKINERSNKQLEDK